MPSIIFGRIKARDGPLELVGDSHPIWRGSNHRISIINYANSDYDHLPVVWSMCIEPGL